jgi:hypothetical protein
VGGVTVGEMAIDVARGRVGVVMDREGPYVQLRPLGGGREWDARPEDVRPATAAEQLSAKVAEANANAVRGWGR